MWLFMLTFVKQILQTGGERSIMVVPKVWLVSPYEIFNETMIQQFWWRFQLFILMRIWKKVNSFVVYSADTTNFNIIETCEWLKRGNYCFQLNQLISKTMFYFNSGQSWHKIIFYTNVSTTGQVILSHNSTAIILQTQLSKVK